MAVDPFIQAELDRKLTDKDFERAGKMNVWGAPKPKAEPAEEEKYKATAERLTSRVRQKAAYSEKLKQVLDYYAASTVPFDRIAQHTKLKPDAVAAEMKSRGRLS
jgi:hypothetical protein